MKKNIVIFFANVLIVVFLVSACSAEKFKSPENNSNQNGSSDNVSNDPNESANSSLNEISGRINNNNFSLKESDLETRILYFPNDNTLVLEMVHLSSNDNTLSLRLQIVVNNISQYHSNDTVDLTDSDHGIFYFIESTSGQTTTTNVRHTLSAGTLTFATICSNIGNCQNAGSFELILENNSGRIEGKYFVTVVQEGLLAN